MDEKDVLIQIITMQRNAALDAAAHASAKVHVLTAQIEELRARESAQDADRAVS
jgi:hypothetical protein